MLPTIIEAAGGGAMDVLTFLGDATGDSWIYVPLIYCAVFHEATNRRVARLLRAIRSGKNDSDS